jgi:DNA primase
LQRRDWKGRAVGQQQEFVGLCPLHEETHPSFYVNARKNLFYCHGCGRGGDLIRLVEMSMQLSFGQSVAYLEQMVTGSDAELLEQTAAFYRRQLRRWPQGRQYLQRRGLYDIGLIDELEIGYAPGGVLRRHLTGLGYPFDMLLRAGLIDDQGRDAFYQRVIFPCRQQGRVRNLYGRSVGEAFPHRLLPCPTGGLYRWESVRHNPAVIVVEGLFDLALLWQAGFRHTTCSLGAHLTATQWTQLCDRPGRSVYLVFDEDENRAGQKAARRLAQRLACAGVTVHIVSLPPGHDPNSFLAAGATAADFSACLQRAHTL